MRIFNHPRFDFYREHPILTIVIVTVVCMLGMIIKLVKEGIV